MRLRGRVTLVRLLRRFGRLAAVFFCVGAALLILAIVLPPRQPVPVPHSTPSISNAVWTKPDADEFFDDSRIHEFRFAIAGEDWWQRILDSATTREDVEADLEFDGVLYPRVGLRIKGSSSAMVQSDKKPFNLKMNAFRDGQTLYGLTTLNFNNGAYDPTLTRERIAGEIFRHYLPSPRMAYARVFLNGEYRGIYVVVEQINRTMLRQWFTDASGSRFKGDAPAGTRLGSSRLNWLGDSVDDYKDNYELKSTDDPAAWQRLIRLIDDLNHTTGPEFEETIERRIDVDRALWYVAVDNLVVNLDDYVGAGHNYYLYFDRAANDRASILPWDLNESFGVHGPRRDPALLSPLHHETVQNRPLSYRLLSVPRWRALYLAHYRTLLRRWFDWDRVIGPLHDSFQAKIRADVERDGNYLFSMTRFEDLATDACSWMGHRIPPLEKFVRERQAFLHQHPDLSRSGPTIRDVQATGRDDIDRSATLSITARVLSTAGVRAVTLRLEREGLFRDLPMERVDGDSYRATLAPSGDTSVVRYYILATDSEGRVEVAPEDAEYRVFELRLTAD